jgi:CheY-like chemotaxis protein
LKSVLVVEADHACRVEIRSLLEAAGYFVVSAANGAAALAQLDSISIPTIILVAQKAPLMSGDEFLEILARKSEFSSIPVLQLKDGNEPNMKGVCCSVQKTQLSSRLILEIEDCLTKARP